MRSCFLFTSMFLVIAVPLSASADRVVDYPTPRTAAEAETRASSYKGKVFASLSPAGGSIHWGYASAAVNAPVDQVMEIIQDYGQYHAFMPNFTQSRVLSRRGANAMVYFQASVLRGSATLWAQMRIREKRPIGSTRVVEASLLDGNFEQFRARWEVTPIGEGMRSLVTFKLLVEPNLPLPSSIYSKENRKAARKVLKSIRQRAAVSRGAMARAR